MGKTLEEQIQLKVELEHALTQVEIGAKYRHYKATHKIYTVQDLAFQEEDNQLCVIYKADYEERLTYIRPFNSWIAMVEWEGETVPRFAKL